jgi:hypothetical protein
MSVFKAPLRVWSKIINGQVRVADVVRIYLLHRMQTFPTGIYNPTIQTSMNQPPRLPLDVLRETLNHLDAKDLLKCQQVSSDLRLLVQNSNELQLRMHLEEHGIQPASRNATTDSGANPHTELEKLRGIEARMAEGDFGSSDQKRQSLRLREGNCEAMHLITMANGFLFTPWGYRNSVDGMVGIAQYRLDDLSFPPKILQFEQSIRHYQVDPAEGILLVVFLDDE